MSEATGQGALRSAGRILLDGMLVVVPAGAIVLLVLGIVNRLRDVADPLSGRYVHPAVVAALLFVLLCLLVGALVRSAPGRQARRWLEPTLFDKLPGYRLVKAFTDDGDALTSREGRKPRPALVSIEEGECPCLLMQRFDDGRVLVFVPGTPAPLSGALYIFAADRVRELDVPILPFMKAISSWGLGLPELLAKAAPPGRP